MTVEDTKVPAADDVKTPEGGDEQNLKAGDEKGADDGKSGEDDKSKVKVPEEPKIEAKKHRAQERINDITKHRRIAEADVGRLRDVLEKATGIAPPSPKDFKSPELYTEAFMDYATKVKMPEAQLKDAEGRIAQNDQDYVIALAESWDEAVEAEKAEDPDWEKTVKSLRVKTSPELNLAIMESPYGTKILKYLAQNQDEAKDLASMSTSAQNRRIGYLESKVQRAAPKDAPAVKEKDRPNDPPDNSLKGSKGAGGAKDVKTMSMAEYRKFRGLDK